MTKRRGASRKVERRERPRWIVPLLRAALLISVTAGVGWSIHWLKQPENLPLNSVRVMGELKHVDRTMLQQVIAPFARQGFAGVEIGELGAALQSMAWVDSATIRRRWPDTLEVVIAEQQPLARWGELGLLNIHGEFFAVAPTAEFETLPLLLGPKGSEVKMAEHYARMGRLLKPIGLSLSQLRMDERRSLEIEIAGGTKLLLGRSAGYERLLRFVRVYPRVFAERIDTIEQLDLRYTNGLAVQWQQGFAPEAV